MIDRIGHFLKKLFETYLRAVDLFLNLNGDAEILMSAAQVCPGLSLYISTELGKLLYSTRSKVQSLLKKGCVAYSNGCDFENVPHNVW